MTEESISMKEKGFTIYRSGQVRRLTPTQFLIPNGTDHGSFLAEIQDGKWRCDCNRQLEECEHRFAAQLVSATICPGSNDAEERPLKCRYCGSLDISGTGYRYNAYGISKRIRCNECHRKFSIKQSNSSGFNRLPSETIWLLSEIGMVLNKLELLIEKCTLNVQERSVDVD
jgi:hypothetical protein